MKKIILNKLTFILFALAMTNVAFAQTAAVKGKVADEQLKALDFVNIILMRANDSSIVKSTITATDGSFELKDLAAGSYFLSAKLFGFKDFQSAVFQLNNAAYDLGQIKLSMATKTLNEVTVTAKKPLIERKADKVILNVESSTLATGSTALEVLERAPGVTVDHNEQISMQGKQGVNVMLDGKMTYMSNADLVNLLKSMSSDEIETIELITNPSSKYDASGNAGIINIKRKKGKGLGTNGSLSSGFGYSEHYRGNGGISINNRSKVANIFGSYNYNYREGEQNLSLNRIAINPTASTYFSQLAYMERMYQNNNLKIGADFFVSKKSTLGFLATSYRSDGNEDNINNTNVGKAYTQRDSSIYVTSNADNKYRTNSFNLNYKTNIDDKGQELSFDADYSKYKGRENGQYDNYFSNANGTASKNPWFFRNLSPSDIDIASLKLDYTKPLVKDLKLEAGLKSSWVTTDNNFQFSQKNNGSWENVTNRSNHFIYDENVLAGYANLSTTYKKINIQAGLRAEQTFSKGNLVTTDSVVNRSYLNFFPTLHLSSTVGKNHDLSLSYSRRINRPDYDALNPFMFYLDQYTFQKGNPFLNPQFSNNIELGYTFKKQYNITLGYSLTTDLITQVILPDNATKSMFQTNVNLDKQINYSANINIPVTIRKWWSMTNNINVFYLGFKSANLDNQTVNNGTVAMQYFGQNNFVINKTFGAELSANYSTPGQFGIINVNAQYAVNIGFSKSFLNKKMNLRFVLNDVFDTRRQVISSAYSWVQFGIVQKNDTRFGNLSLSYKFGKNDVKPSRRRSTGLESEQGRLKN